MDSCGALLPGNTTRRTDGRARSLAVWQTNDLGNELVLRPDFFFLIFLFITLEAYIAADVYIYTDI